MARSVKALWGVTLLCCLVLGTCSPRPSAFLQKASANNVDEQVDVNGLFVSWMEMHQKDYNGDAQEFARRLDIFKSNVQLIADHNAQESTFKMAVNEYADMTAEEFQSTKLGLNPKVGGSFRPHSPDNSEFMYADVNVASLAKEVDWVQAGAVTPVKNQLTCGSCWAFSTTGSVEGVNFLQTGELTSLSEQELVDCDKEKDLGCGGGLMDYAFKYIIENGGIDTEADYTYWSMDLPCNKLRENRTVVTIDDFQDVPKEDEEALQKAAAHQPISVAICATPLQFYSSGIVTKCCNGLNHGVLVVGYGTENGVPYWLVKNSWGAGWGDGGYFKLARNVADKQGTCGVAMAPSFPIKTSPNPKVVNDVCGWLGWSECSGGTTCSCRWNLFGLLCLDWGCAAPSA